MEKPGLTSRSPAVVVHDATYGSPVPHATLDTARPTYLLAYFVLCRTMNVDRNENTKHKTQKVALSNEVKTQPATTR